MRKERHQSFLPWEQIARRQLSPGQGAGFHRNPIYQLLGLGSPLRLWYFVTVAHVKTHILHRAFGGSIALLTP